MMRRELFTAAPLLALPALLATDSAAGVIDEQTPVARLFRTWDMERNRINGPEGEAMTEDEYNREIEQFSKLDDQMRLAPAQTARDVILKVIVLSEYGNCGLPQRNDFPQLWIEAERFSSVNAI